MLGNQGVIGGDLESRFLSERIGGVFDTLTDLLALPVSQRANHMICLVLADCTMWVFDTDGIEGEVPVVGSGTWRPVRNLPMLYSRSFSMLAAALVDADAYVTTRSTVTTADVLTTVELDGTLANPAPGVSVKTGVGFWPTVTTSSTVGAFVADSLITLTGTYSGAAVTRTVTVGSADGNETLFADGPMETITQIDVAAQADTDGTYTVGFSGISPRQDALGQYTKWYVKSYADAANADTAAVVVGYADGTTDTIELPKGGALEAAPVRIYGTTTAPITVYE